MFPKLLEHTRKPLGNLRTVKVRGLSVVFWRLHHHEVSSNHHTLSGCLQVHQICIEAVVGIDHEGHNDYFYVPY
jgi:hypothetical protein